MKNHELLDLIGGVNEDYVLEAGNNVARPRFGWKTLAACAACAALVLGAYPVYQMSQSQDTSGLLPLHDYTIVEGSGMTTLGDVMMEDVKTPAQGTGASAPDASSGEDGGQEGVDGVGYDVPGQDAPVQEAAQAQYLGLLQGLGGQGGYLPETYPDWYGGAWIDNSYYPEAKLAVAIVDGLRTPELEAQIGEWCGGEVVFQDAKYALAYLYELQDLVVDAMTDGGDGLSGGIGVDVMENCLGVDIYSNGADIPKEVLVKLGQLDPRGDAIRVRLFTDKLDTLTDEVVKGPVPGGAQTNPAPVENAGQESMQIAPDPNTIGELPQAKYDAIAGGE